jgi:cytochrome bd ubiquinol oxidase subunit II
MGRLPRGREGEAMVEALPLVWFLLLDLSLLAFLLLDGADLGIGILAIRPTSEDQRSIMLAAIGPLWYANETWLVIAGAILFGAFPRAYGLALSALYVPAMMLIFGLILRAVSIEFRPHAKARRFWGAVFAGGSLLAVAGQGFMLGGVLSGVRVQGELFAGGPWDWLNPLSAVVATGTVLGYAMLGGAYLLRRYEGPFLAGYGRRLRIAAIAALAVFVLSLPLLSLVRTSVSGLWLRPQNLVVVAVLLAGALLGFVMVLRCAARPTKGRNAYPWAVLVFVCVAAAVLAGVFPYIIPPSLSIAAAAASTVTLRFMLIGVAIVLPLIVVYSLYVRRVFRSRVTGPNRNGEY